MEQSDTVIRHHHLLVHVDKQGPQGIEGAGDKNIHPEQNIRRETIPQMVKWKTAQPHGVYSAEESYSLGSFFV
jgi:hypothetical protein